MNGRDEVVIDLDAHRVHYNVACSCGIHVVPKVWILQLAKGAPDIVPLPDCLLRAILDSWIGLMEEVR